MTTKNAMYCIHANLRTSDVGGENLKQRVKELKLRDRQTDKRLTRKRKKEEVKKMYVASKMIKCLCECTKYCNEVN